MDESISNPKSSQQYWTVDDIKNKLASEKVVVFSKGTKDHPRCGYSAQTLDELSSLGNQVEVIDVSKNRSIVAALRTVTGRKALPMICYDGALMSCSDDLPELLASGTLKESIQKRIAHKN